MRKKLTLDHWCDVYVGPFLFAYLCLVANLNGGLNRVIKFYEIKFLEGTNSRMMAVL